MEVANFKAIRSIILVTLILLYSPCHADINVSAGWECSQADNSTMDNAFQTNLNNILNSLATNDPRRNGFHTTTTGKGSNTIYGLMLCRGDISATVCANCIKNSSTVALQRCPKSNMVKVWFTWCFLSYSNENFFGVWDQFSMAIADDTNFDDPSVVSKGLNFVNELATTAPKQPLMFQTAVLDAGQSGKRYGMAQCTRDISRSDCGKCLDNQLVTFRTTVGNKRAWEIYGSSCSMWYNDFQFYLNFSTPASGGARRSSSHGGLVSGITIAVSALLLIP